jgi:hypothetical protein
MGETYPYSLSAICIQSTAAPGYFGCVNNHLDGGVLINEPIGCCMPYVIGEYGLNVDEKDIVKTVDEPGYKFYETDYGFCFKYDRPSFGSHYWKIFLGWKFQNVHGVERCMLAFCINPFK